MIDDDTGELRAFMEENARCWREADIDGLRALIAPDAETVMIGTDASEILRGGERIVQAVAGQLATLERLELDYREVHCHRNGDVGWVDAVTDMSFTVGGETMEVPGARQTVVLVRRNGSWRMVQGHTSLGVRMPDPSPPDR